MCFCEQASADSKQQPRERVKNRLAKELSRRIVPEQNTRNAYMCKY
jgi:hypothetical protein